MEYRDNTAYFQPYEISILFGRGGLRPPALPDEPTVDWDGLKYPLIDIQNTGQGANVATLRRFSGLEIPDPSTADLGKYGRRVRELPQALSVLAQRAVAREKQLAGDKAPSVQVRETLAAELGALVANKRANLLYVRCVDKD